MVVRKSIQDAGKEWNQITMESYVNSPLSRKERADAHKSYTKLLYCDERKEQTLKGAITLDRHRKKDRATDS